MIAPLATDLGVRRLLTAAGEAPSVLNTQPWRFRVVRRDCVEVLADQARRLTVSDPRGRSMHVSCGAALLNLRLAIRRVGYQPQVWLRPNPVDEPDLVASVRITGRDPATMRERELYAAIPMRRTNRQPFSDRPIPPDVIGELRVAASREGASLIPVTGAPARELLEYAVIADEELAYDEDYQRELARWTLPTYVRGPAAAGDPSPLRDFGRREEKENFEAHPQLAVLTTAGDRPVDWLRAGQALQRVLLHATLKGVSASFLNQPLDLRDMRGRSDPRHPRGHPQMIIRLGYGPAVPRVPRRPATELTIVPAYGDLGLYA